MCQVDREREGDVVFAPVSSFSHFPGKFRKEKKSLISNNFSGSLRLPISQNHSIFPKRMFIYIFSVADEYRSQNVGKPLLF